MKRSQSLEDISTGKAEVPVSDITITLLRASKPVKALRRLRESGYRIDNAYPGIYYIEGMVDIRMQIIVTSELDGDDYVALRIQRKNAAKKDYKLFSDNVRSVYTLEENEYLESIVKNGLYDGVDELIKAAGEDREMYEKLMELFKDELSAAEAKGRSEGEAERKALEEQIKALKEELKKAKAAML